LRPRYSCGSQVISVCHDIAESLDNGVRLDAIAIDFSRPDSENSGLGMELRVVGCEREFPLGRKQRVRVGGQLSDEIESTVSCTARELIGSTFVSRLHK